MVTINLTLHEWRGDGQIENTPSQGGHKHAAKHDFTENILASTSYTSGHDKACSSNRKPNLVSAPPASWVRKTRLLLWAMLHMQHA
jgi:hypothetical protein